MSEEDPDEDEKFNQKLSLVHISYEKGEKVSISLDGKIIETEDASNSLINLNKLTLGENLDGDVYEVILLDEKTIDSSGDETTAHDTNMARLKAKWSIDDD